jgi:hypothetical protein
MLVVPGYVARRQHVILAVFVDFCQHHLGRFSYSVALHTIYRAVFESVDDIVARGNVGYAARLQHVALILADFFFSTPCYEFYLALFTE